MKKREIWSVEHQALFKKWSGVLFDFPLYGCRLASSALYSLRSVCLNGILFSPQVAVSLQKTTVVLLFLHWRPQWVYDICICINRHPWHLESVLQQFSQTSSRSSSQSLDLCRSPAWASLELHGTPFDKPAPNYGCVWLSRLPDEMNVVSIERI